MTPINLRDYVEGSQDQNELKIIATTSLDDTIRLLAIAKIKDRKFVDKLLQKRPYLSIDHTIAKLSGNNQELMALAAFCLEHLESGGSRTIGRIADHITDPNLLSLLLAACDDITTQQQIASRIRSLEKEGK